MSIGGCFVSPFQIITFNENSSERLHVAVPFCSLDCNCYLLFLISHSNICLLTRYWKNWSIDACFLRWMSGALSLLSLTRFRELRIRSSRSRTTLIKSFRRRLVARACSLFRSLLRFIRCCSVSTLRLPYFRRGFRGAFRQKEFNRAPNDRFQHIPGQVVHRRRKIESRLAQCWRPWETEKRVNTNYEYYTSTPLQQDLK